MILGTYHESYGELLEDQWLFKSTERNRRDGDYMSCFLTKLTQKGQLPVKFADWGKSYPKYEPPITYVWQETFRSGWRLQSWRIGMSQEWAVIQNPEGYELEIYLDNFLELVKENTIECGMLIGKFKWSHNKLIKE